MPTDRLPRLATLSLTASICLLLAVGVLGPSAVVLDVSPGPGRDWLPPYWFDAHPGPWLVTALTDAGLVVGGIGLWLAVTALRAGWTPDPRRVVGAGAAAAAGFVLVPPMASADVLIYAAYGRIAALGGDPYTTTAADLASRGDPIGMATEPPWESTPSVYGPVATAVQELASRLGGESVQATVFWLSAVNALAFVLAGWLLLRLAPDRPRAAVLWAANPLLLFCVVGGAHIDGLMIAAGVAALVVLSRSALLAGILLGLAGGVKLSIGLWGLAFLLVLLVFQRSPRRALLLAAGALVALVPPYAMAGSAALDQVRESSRFTSLGSIWRPVRSLVETWIPAEDARTVVAVGGWLLAAAIALLLARVVRAARPEVRAALVVSAAWLLTAPYSLPWYDAMVWAPLAVALPSLLDRLMIVRTTVFSLAYVPGRSIPLPDALHTVTVEVVRGVLAPAVTAGLLATLTIWSARRPQPGLASGPAPPR